MFSSEQYRQARLARDVRFDGQFFVGVKTTGIFCRPICPAPPAKEHNVEYFSIAEMAMQAGYRPCLRCRPDSAPHSYAWKGVDTTVERGLRLLQQHPDLPLNMLADKLGITDRYFRKLFNEKLGISPKQYQLFQQVLFAKQLLHQTQLTVEQIAQACGFQSSRRLQDNMKKCIQLTPSQIRSKTVNKANGINLQLGFRPPYNWPRLRDFLARRAVDGVETITDDSYSRSFTIEGERGFFKATYLEQQQKFDVEIELDDLNHLKAVTTKIRRILDLDTDTLIIEESLLKCGFKQEQIVSGLRLPGIWSCFEAGCRAILGQQISVTAAIKLLNTMVNHLGVEKEQKFYFPTPEIVAQSDLAFLKMPSARKQTLKRFAEFVGANPNEDNLRQWLNIKGIGPWTVSYGELRGQSNPDIWLDTDLVVKNQLANLCLDPEQAKPWRSYLTFQLWSMA